MEGFLIGIAFLNITQLALVWYKLGRVERAVTDHCKQYHKHITDNEEV